MRDGNDKLGKRQTLDMCLKIIPVSPFLVLIISPPPVSCLRAESGIFLPASPEAPDTWFVALFKASMRQRREWGTQDWEGIWQCCQTHLQLSAEHPFPKQLWSQTTAPALGLGPLGGGDWRWSFTESLTLLRESTLRDSSLCFSGLEWWLTPVNLAGDWGKRITARLSPAWVMYWVPDWPGPQNGTLSLTNTSSKSSSLDDFPQTTCWGNKASHYGENATEFRVILPGDTQNTELNKDHGYHDTDFLRWSFIERNLLDSILYCGFVWFVNIHPVGGVCTSAGPACFKP